MKARMVPLLLGGVIFAFVGCNEGSDESTVTSELSAPESTADLGQVPDAEQLAEMLLTDADLDGGWSVNPWGLPPTDWSSINFGESKFRQLVCDDAPEDFRAAVHDLHWQAFVHLDDSADENVVEELLWADEPDVAESFYATLEKGLDVCMRSSMDAEGAGGVETWEALAVPEVGDERMAVLISHDTFQYVALVRDGPVLMYVYMTARPTADNTEAEFEQMMQTAAAKIT